MNKFIQPANQHKQTNVRNCHSKEARFIWIYNSNTDINKANMTKKLILLN